jgi:hypothetical protein
MKVASYQSTHKINNLNSRVEMTTSTNSLKEEFLSQFFDSHGNLRN